MLGVVVSPSSSYALIYIRSLIDEAKLRAVFGDCVTYLTAAQNYGGTSP